MPKKLSKFNCKFNLHSIAKTIFKVLFCFIHILEDIVKEKKEVTKKRKEGVHVAKDHLKDPLQTLESVWENKKGVVNVDNFDNCFKKIVFDKSN